MKTQETLAAPADAVVTPDPDLMTDEEVKAIIDRLSQRTKRWLHHAAQQINDPDADGYCDHEASRLECVEAGLITHRQKKGYTNYIEVCGRVNRILYSEKYLWDHRFAESE